MVLWDERPPAGSNSCHIQQVIEQQCTWILLCLQKLVLHIHIYVAGSLFLCEMHYVDK